MRIDCPIGLVVNLDEQYYSKRFRDQLGIEKAFEHVNILFKQRHKSGRDSFKIKCNQMPYICATHVQYGNMEDSNVHVIIVILRAACTCTRFSNTGMYMYFKGMRCTCILKGCDHQAVTLNYKSFF